MATIILIDDNESFVWVIKRTLEKSGYQVLGMHHASTALRYLDEGPVDLVITDLNLPGIDGFGIISEIRRRGLNIPIIAVSGEIPMGDTFSLPRARQFGADRIIAKPFLPHCLMEQVEELLGTHTLPADICAAMI
ncbi:MAG: response regulator [Verrucomicrobiales bacterium]|nr:response regulator [Verrucomicrobiales bacterium]